jgi:hypothetical protein
MDTVLTRTGDAPATRRPMPATDRLGRMLLRMVQTAAERVVLTHSEPPPEWYRYPLP